MRHLIILFLLFIQTSFSAQEDTIKENTKIRLINWSSVDCDNTYDANKLQSRITNLERKEGLTYITVNFSDNCCAKFQPVINFENEKLMLFPYEKYIGSHCTCSCCFSIVFEIDGLENSNYEVYFENKKIDISDNHYKVDAPTFEIINGDTLNRTNKYGFSEGTWVEYGEDEDIYSKSIMHYPAHSLYYEPRADWLKSYGKTGELIFFRRKDTTEAWFQNGDLNYQRINYSIGDTTFEKVIDLYEDGQLEEKYLKRKYPVEITSEFNSTYKGSGNKWDFIYKEEFYANGQAKFLQSHDTSYIWFENGILNQVKYESGWMEYNDKGNLLTQVYLWKEPGNKNSSDLSYSLYLEYRNKEKLESIHLVRDQLSGINGNMSPNVHYYWKWDKKYNLIEKPEKWEEVYPWDKISPSISIPKKNRKQLK